MTEQMSSPVCSPSLFWRTPPFSPLTVPAPLSSFPSPIAPQPRTGLLCKDRGSSVLERKRPPVIAVPTGFFFSAADAAPEKAEEEVVEEGDGYGVYSKRGKNRGRLEDLHSAIPDLGGDPDQVELTKFTRWNNLGYFLMLRS
ncbi:hypothetical protein SAY86_016724 [Trapa natans]|uniref:Uncharacterized protein n=1 Tax=Trapa natans TaxID=22666 RepID=A0AAN7LNU6_TRANT|nr:hypothetical protein SAY86_016724 [Trapa natans]